MKIPFKWEKISEVKSVGRRVTSRAKVIGGWLVRHSFYTSDGMAHNNSMVFISDAEHEWEV
jgi:hypothetical protein